MFFKKKYSKLNLGIFGEKLSKIYKGIREVLFYDKDGIEETINTLNKVLRSSPKKLSDINNKEIKSNKDYPVIKATTEYLIDILNGDYINIDVDKKTLLYIMDNVSIPKYKDIIDILIEEKGEYVKTDSPLLFNDSMLNDSQKELCKSYMNRFPPKIIYKSKTIVLNIEGMKNSIIIYVGQEKNDLMPLIGSSCINITDSKSYYYIFDGPKNNIDPIENVMKGDVYKSNNYMKMMFDIGIRALGTFNDKKFSIQKI